LQSFSIHSDAAEKSGGLRGQVNYCGKGGVEGMVVFIPGRQFVVMTDNTGGFLFESLPAGSYDLHYLIGNQLVNHNRDVKVPAGHVLDLAEISFCQETQNSDKSKVENNDTSSIAVPLDKEESVEKSQACQAGSSNAECQDKDKDGVIAQKDCNDNDPRIRPGALEECDGVDNNCNGIIDDVSEFYLTHGLGRCDNGKKAIRQCDKGYADCDGDPTNGCEVNTKNDSENCGACGNRCSNMDMCQLGFC
jgi:hypothetical protein